MEAVANFLSNLRVYVVASLMIFICAVPFGLISELFNKFFRKGK